MKREDRGAIFNESLEVIRRLWREDEVTHHGRFFSYDNLRIGPTLPRPPEVWLGGIAPSELRRVGRLDAGYTKFVLLPATDLASQPRGITEELERIAADAVTLEHD